MPTALPPSRASMKYGPKVLAIMNDPNLIVVTGFTAIGLLLTISFAAFLRFQ
jgi:hypothetical protein